MELEQRIEQAKKELAQSEAKKTWRERFGFFRIMWIFIWGVALGASYLYVWISYPTIFEPKTVMIINNVQAKTIDQPVDKSEEKVVEKKSGIFYTYNAEESQTDGNPYRTASGRIVRDGIVANNCLDFGTKIDVEGVGILDVQDRMNSRYGCNDFDVFRENPNQNFKKTLKYTIL